MEQNKVQKLAEDLWRDFADESDGWQTTMNYESFIKAMHKALDMPVAVGRNEQLVDFLRWLRETEFNIDGHSIEEVVDRYQKSTN